MGGKQMLDFEKELEKFKPVLNIQHIEERIDQDGIKDMIDIVKTFSMTGGRGMMSEPYIMQEYDDKE